MPFSFNPKKNFKRSNENKEATTFVVNSNTKENLENPNNGSPSLPIPGMAKSFHNQKPPAEETPSSCCASLVSFFQKKLHQNATSIPLSSSLHPPAAPVAISTSLHHELSELHSSNEQENRYDALRHEHGNLRKLQHEKAHPHNVIHSSTSLQDLIHQQRVQANRVFTNCIAQDREQLQTEKNNTPAEREDITAKLADFDDKTYYFKRLYSNLLVQWQQLPVKVAQPSSAAETRSLTETSLESISQYLWEEYFPIYQRAYRLDHPQLPEYNNWLEQRSIEFNVLIKNFETLFRTGLEKDVTSEIFALQAECLYRLTEQLFSYYLTAKTHLYYSSSKFRSFMQLLDVDKKLTDLTNKLGMNITNQCVKPIIQKSSESILVTDKNNFGAAPSDAVNETTNPPTEPFYPDLAVLNLPMANELGVLNTIQANESDNLNRTLANFSMFFSQDEDITSKDEDINIVLDEEYVNENFQPSL